MAYSVLLCEIIMLILPHDIGMISWLHCVRHVDYLQVNFTEMEPESGKVSSVMKLRQRFLVQYSTMESDVRRRLGHNISTMLLACTLNDISCNESYVVHDYFETNLSLYLSGCL